MDMKKVVTIPYDPVWEPLEWAKKHCPSYITNDVANDATPFYLREEVESDRKPGRRVFTYYINYYFGNEQDAIIFKLRWS